MPPLPPVPVKIGLTIGNSGFLVEIINLKFENSSGWITELSLYDLLESRHFYTWLDFKH